MFIGFSGGEGGIRTPDTRQGMSAFEADRFNHSRTSPRHESGSGSRNRISNCRGPSPSAQDLGGGLPLRSRPPNASTFERSKKAAPSQPPLSYQNYRTKMPARPVRISAGSRLISPLEHPNRSRIGEK